MSKENIVSTGVQSIQSGQLQVLSDVLGSVYDQAALEQKAADGTLSQADVDAAVAKAVSDLQAADAQVLADAQAKASSDLASLQSALVAMTAKEQLEEQAVADVKAKIDSVQASFDAIRALLAPAPQA